MGMLLLGERLDDLQCGGLMLIQRKDGYCFTGDAVALSDFLSVKKGERLCDLCSGSGVVALLAAAKNPGMAEAVCVELQPRLACSAARSVRLNGLSARIKVHAMPLQGCAAVLGRERFDAVSCNPPYNPVRPDMTSQSAERRRARHETDVTLSDIAAESAALLKNGGRLYMVHLADRCAEVFFALRGCGIEPKLLRPVQSAPDAPPRVVLIGGIKGGKPGLRFMPPLFMQP